MRIDVLTLFPEIFHGFLECSIVGRARAANIVRVELIQIRDFAEGPYKKVDDKPYGGGPGMVLMCGPIYKCVAYSESLDTTPARRVLLTPQGQSLTQKKVHELASLPRILLICGHYEGFDERIRVGLQPEEISVGDYVLSGGETAAMILIDAVTRLQKDALGDETSTCEESFSNGLLEYPQYTRPQEFQEMRVPDILLSGDHNEIKRWRLEQSILRTRQRRPDLEKST